MASLRGHWGYPLQLLSEIMKIYYFTQFSLSYFSLLVCNKIISIDKHFIFSHHLFNWFEKKFLCKKLLFTFYLHERVKRASGSEISIRFQFFSMSFVCRGVCVRQSPQTHPSVLMLDGWNFAYRFLSLMQKKLSTRYFNCCLVAEICE